MERWQQIHRRLLRMENSIIVVLLVLAALFAAPSFRHASPTTAQRAEEQMTQRLMRISERARNEQRTYTVKYHPQTSEVMVSRWLTRDLTAAHAEYLAELSNPLPNGVVITGTTIYTHEIIINESGFYLSSGTISLRAPDGSRAVVTVGEHDQ